jgi:hypothetical protein
MGVDVTISIFPAIWRISCKQLPGLTGPCVPKKKAAETISALLWSAIFMVGRLLPDAQNADPDIPDISEHKL